MSDNAFIDETSLIRLIALQHDQNALSELYRRYGRAVYSLAFRVVQNNTLAEEVTQDTFLKVWNQPETWDPQRGKLVSWLLTIARYTAIDRLRREQRRPLGAPLDDILELVGKRELIDDPAWQDGKLIRSLIVRLPAEQIEVIELAFYQGMTHTEMAEHLKLPLGTVKTRVRLGLQKLKAMWTEATAEPNL